MSLRAPSLLLCLAFAGCSSGGGGGASAPASAAPAATTPAPSRQANRAPHVPAGTVVADEEQDLVLPLSASDPDGDPLRVFVLDRPPGSTWDEARGELRFRPDFTQGGRSYAFQVLASDGRLETRAQWVIDVRDSIAPPAPRIVARERGAGFTRLVVEQTTDSFLDSPRRAGRTFQAIVCAPDGAHASAPLPVRVALHGFGGSPWRDGWSGEFRIAPHDPENTYWWGYADALPGAPTSGAAPPYTQRRVLHLLSWVLETQPGADPERVYLEGASMGGAGAATLGLLSARHFCWVRATYGQAIPRNHRPSRQQQLATLWGSAQQNLSDGRGMGVWDRMDLARALRDSPEAREAFLFLHHGKDDGIIHFGAVVHDSPRTGRSLYEALQEQRAGHFAVWDEGGHVQADPHLPGGWWESGWNPVFDGTSFLRRRLSFPAFSRSGLDDDPGDGQGNGRQAWDPEAGYAANPAVLDDTGWSGQRAGAINRFLRWDATGSVDTPARWAMPLRVLDGPGGSPPRPGDPTLGDLPPSGRPAVVDVTPRRVQAFTCRPGEQVRWRFGAASGIAVADAEGAVTVQGLRLSPTWTVLELTRVP